MAEQDPMMEEPRVDPVSGNEVPPGAIEAEVRDDVPAMLSEGEYVVPADVLRYYGVKFFEELGKKAKMEMAGMTGAPQVEEPEEPFPFAIEELQVEDDSAEQMPMTMEQQMYKGGLVMKKKK